MAKDMDESKPDTGAESPAVLRAISVAGYKSIGEKQRIEIRPLTLLAGANSGGKSSLIQPMLLLKQTLEAPYDPGSLLLDGPNVRLTSTEQLLTKCLGDGYEQKMIVGFEFGNAEMEFVFGKAQEYGMEIIENYIKVGDDCIRLNTNLSSGQIKELAISHRDRAKTGILIYGSNDGFFVVRDRFFFRIEVAYFFSKPQVIPLVLSIDEINPESDFIDLIRSMIHLPGLRGNPGRAYKLTGVSDKFGGVFENYVASLIYFWKTKKDWRLVELEWQLSILGLTWKIDANRLNDAQVELKVARLPQESQQDTDDLVSIADVGFGVSQTLPVLVALLAANPGQVVYLEQPEIHLHPRAQLAMAKILAEAAQRGVMVIAETHSALLLQGVQTLVAKDELDQNLVKLHWVQRDAKGMTQVNSADLDDTGAFGDWPVDFMEVGLDADNDYLSAAEAKLFRKPR